MKAIYHHLLYILVAGVCLWGCAKEDMPANPALPTLDEIEVGTNNNETGIIGRDFHFNAKVLAGDKINLVGIEIRPRSGITYPKPWSFSIEWAEYKGSKNATIHKHFDIPTTAVEGVYDFVIIVTDENGARLETKKNITIYDPANLPIDPSLALLNLHVNDLPFYRNNSFVTPGLKLKKKDMLSAQAAINNVKGNGKIYLLLISKKKHYRPESIDNIDFSKVIVYDVYEHKDWSASNSFSNFVFDLSNFQTIRNIPKLSIGAASDNNTPTPNPITGSNAWETGDYYFGVLYKNQTYNLSVSHYIEFGIDLN